MGATDFKSSRAPETGIDDISNIDSNIANLFTRFVQPIDKIKSMSRPDVSQNIVKSDSSSTPIAKNNFNNLQKIMLSR